MASRHRRDGTKHVFRIIIVLALLSTNLLPRLVAVEAPYRPVLL